MPHVDYNTQAHLDWMGFVQPHGLVVSAPALVRAGAILNRNDREGQDLLQSCVKERVFASGRETEPWIPDFESFARGVLGWKFSPKVFASASDGQDAFSALTIDLAEHEETLRPDYAIRHWPIPTNGGPEWQLLIRTVGPNQAFDSAERGRGALEATTHGRMERLLRATGVSAGLIFNGREIRLISAPRGETSGWLDFRVRDMMLTAGRPIVAAMRLLLNQSRLLTLPQDQRLPALLKESREYQNVVSERLAEQVLHALYELLRGFQAAHELSKGTLLRREMEESPDTVYRSLLTVILRLVFLLYAEQRDLLPSDETFLRFYSLAGLHDRLREDAAQYPDTMDQRYGAWAQLVVLFRMIHDGAKSGGMELPARQGALFDPDRFDFLGRVPVPEGAEANGHGGVPLVPDGTVYRVLEKLLVLDGERISYRALDVEQIGSVYETMMGFRLETATGVSISIKAAKKNGAPSTIDIDALLEEDPAKRRKWIQDRTDRKITDKVNRAVREAKTIDGIYAALETVIDKNATPDRVPGGSMILQPSEERRRSGSHYTPRSLTGPIVRKTIGPVMDDLREKSDGRLAPEQILEIKVCDPAMGSGAFLVESCRQLGDALVEAWQTSDAHREILAGEDEVIAARRIVAQKCLYGVDRNPVAVDLAKMSLWLVTLAKNHPLTFVDHALRHGDSLLGLTRDQIESFHWRDGEKRFAAGLELMEARKHLKRVAEARKQIRDAGPDVSQAELKALWGSVEDQLGNVRLLGDCVLAAFFEGRNAKTREAACAAYAEAILDQGSTGQPNPLNASRFDDKPLASFHWEIEFPEVFERERPGFDGVVGNPPFAGKNSVAAANADGYTDWLRTAHSESHGNADLAAHFFRRAFSLLRNGGSLGLIATNTIAQGDTRSTGLRWICTHGGEIYDATRRLQWPGLAAVIVSVLHIYRGAWARHRMLDGLEVSSISAFLAEGSTHEDPARLTENEGQSFVGSFVLGMGFTFDDTDKKGVASTLAEMQRLTDLSPKNKEVIFPFIGGEELNSRPTHAHHRYIINFWDYPLRRDPELTELWIGASKKRQQKWLREGVVPKDYPRPVAADWPELLQIVRDRVIPSRADQRIRSLRERWWRYAAHRPALHSKIKCFSRVLAISQVGQHASFGFLPTGLVYAHTLIIFPFDTYSAFCMLQSRLHEVWARCFGSSMKDDLRYTPSDCFETFPFPEGWPENAMLEKIGAEYYDFRSDLMVKRSEGMTKTYNRFHDRYEKDPDIVRLRELHEQMDRAVLDEYGWDDIPTRCEFLPDHADEDGTSAKRHWRYRWPDDVRDRVLGRLIELNAQRTNAERASPEPDQAKPGRHRTGLRESGPAARSKKSSEPEVPPLFAE